MDSEDWYYTDGENSIGPFSEQRLRALHIAGVITPETLVCRAGVDEWTSFATAIGGVQHVEGVKPQADRRPPSVWSKYEQRLAIVAVTASAVGTGFLVLPLNWLPAALWLLAPVLIAIAIIAGHRFAATPRGLSLRSSWPRSARISFIIGYVILALSIATAHFVGFAIWGDEPPYLRHDWRSFDITQPALFSIQASLSAPPITVPSDPPLTSSEQAAAEELSRLISAKNKLWAMTRIKFEHADSARRFAKALSDAAKGFTLLAERISNVPEQYQIRDVESTNKLGQVTVVMTEDSNSKTAEEAKRYIDVSSARVSQFRSNPAVQKAMLELQTALNPPGILADVAAAVLDLCVAFSNPSIPGPIEEARVALEAALSGLESTVDLDPVLRGLLTKALDRRVDLEPQKREKSVVGGPFHGSTYTVETGQTREATEVIAAAAASQKLLTQYPEFALVKPKASENFATLTASADAKTIWDQSLLQKYFGDNAYLPKLDDDLEEVAKRVKSKVNRTADHNYVNGIAPGALLESWCTFTAIGTGGSVEAIVVYHPRTYPTPDLTPLADSIRQTLAQNFKQVASNDVLEVWASEDEKIVVGLRKFPTFELDGETYHGSNNVIFGYAPAAQLVTNKEYHVEPPQPPRESNADSTDPSPSPSITATPTPEPASVELVESPAATPAATPTPAPVKLNVVHGDEVMVLREEVLLFKGQPMETAKVGQKFVVAAHRPDTGKVYVMGKSETGQDIALTLPEEAVKEVPVDVPVLLRSAITAADAGKRTVTEQILARVAKTSPSEPAMETIRKAAAQIETAQTALNQVAQSASAQRAEAARLRQNARTVDRPNPLNPGDTSNQERAQQMREQAEQIESGVSEAMQDAQRQVESARETLRNMDLPTADKPAEMQDNAPVPGLPVMPGTQ